jgi:hypothetical protein
MQTGDHGPAFFSGWRPPRPAADLLLLGTAAYCVDKTASARNNCAWQLPWTPRGSLLGASKD